MLSTLFFGMVARSITIGSSKSSGRASRLDLEEMRFFVPFYIAEIFSSGKSILNSRPVVCKYRREACAGAVAIAARMMDNNRTIAVVGMDR